MKKKIELGKSVDISMITSINDSMTPLVLNSVNYSPSYSVYRSVWVPITNLTIWEITL